MIKPQVEVTTYAGGGNSPARNGGRSPGGFLDGGGDQSRFYHPSGLAVDSEDNIYVADMDNHRVRKISPNRVVTTLAGCGEEGFSDGIGSKAYFARPKGVAVALDGTIYVSDTYNHRIRKITPQGNVTTLAGGGRQGCSNRAGTNAEFAYPSDIAVDVAGNIYVADNHMIRKVSPAGEVAALAGDGSGSDGYADGNSLQARFQNPEGLFVDSSGCVFVADSRNHRIRKISPDGSTSTVAGSGESGLLDGQNMAAQFHEPCGVFLGSKGVLYVADYWNHSIRMVMPQGEVITIAGNGEEGFIDGDGGEARFNFPRAVAINSHGDLFISDQLNHRIRRVRILPAS